MSEFRSVSDVAADLELVERMLDRIADPDEAAAARRVFGVERETVRLARAYAPQPAPAPEPALAVDHLAVARDALARYGAWVDSFPDDDPTPLRARERALRGAIWSVERLEADAE